MKEYKRKHPEFSLCGLNCCLCPRYHTEGSSRCPGCGGEQFSRQHPSCSVITCNQKHDQVEFCYECSSYPCRKYERPSGADSFITYRNVLPDQKAAGENLEGYLRDLDRKLGVLLDLIHSYDDGKSKGFYCLAVNLLPLASLEDIFEMIKRDESMPLLSIKEKARKVKDMLKERAASSGADLVLRK